MEKRFAFGLPLSLCLCACSSPEQPNTPKADAAQPDVPSVVDANDADASACAPPIEATESNGHPDPLTIPANQSRAGRLKQAELPADRTGLAVWKANDFVIANDRVAMIIEAARASELYDPWGGKPVAIAKVQNGKLVNAADFGEIIIGISRFTLETSKVGVVKDGSDGGPAVIRAVGKLKPIEFLDLFVKGFLDDEFSGIEAAIDYTLAPGKDYVDIQYTFRVNEPQKMQVSYVVHGFFQAYRMAQYVPSVAFSSERFAESPYIGYIDDQAVSYAWQSPDGPLKPLIAVSGFDSFLGPALAIDGCSTKSIPFARMTIGGTGLDGLQEALARNSGITLRAITGIVKEASGGLSANTSVFAMVDGKLFTRSTTNEKGEYTVHVPNDKSAMLSAYREGSKQTPNAEASTTTSMVNLQLDAFGSVQVNIRDESSKEAIPAKVQVLPVSGTPLLPAETFGEQRYAWNRQRIAYPATGSISIPLPTGDYQVVVSRGFNYEIVQKNITITTGAPVVVDAELKRTVDNSNVLCADYHIHTHRSPDSGDPAERKLAAIAGEGIEISVRTEHEYVADFEPLIAKLGLGKWMYGVPSVEFTTFAWGHFGVLPLTPDPNALNAGTPLWYGKLPPEVFANIRQKSPSSIMIINHPRSFGGVSSAFGSYFVAANYDPKTGGADNKFWDNEFSVVEVFNQTDFEANRASTVTDWFSLLKQGRKVFAVGASDSHNVLSGSMVGYPRNCLQTGTNNPRELTALKVRDLTHEGKNSVSGGVLISVDGPSGKRQGEEATGVGSSAKVRVKVQAPSWIVPERLEVFVDGTTTQTVTIDASTANGTNPAIRLEKEFDISVAEKGSFVVFAVTSTKDLAPVYPGKKVFGVSNPLFLKR